MQIKNIHIFALKQNSYLMFKGLNYKEWIKQEALYSARRIHNKISEDKIDEALKEVDQLTYYLLNFNFHKLNLNKNEQSKGSRDSGKKE